MNESTSPKHEWKIDGPCPPFPYIPGFSVKIRPYSAPSEAARQSQIHAEELFGDEGTHNVSALEYCIAKPYFELVTEHVTEFSHQAEEHILRVDSILSPSQDIWWNTVQCHLDNNTSSKCLAKIYDPVYASIYASTVLLAHRLAKEEINREVEAYGRISEAGISGKVTPVFLGLWLVDLPVPSKELGGVDYATTRSVPIVLLDHVEGANLESAYLQDYPPEDYVDGQVQLPRAWRREVLAKVYEAVALLQHAGIFCEVNASGIFVWNKGVEDGSLDVRISITDFGMAHVCKEAGRTEERIERPTSPIETFWEGVLDNMNRLTWDEWKRDDDLEYYRQWLVERWGQSTEYRPLSEALQKRIAPGAWQVPE